MDKEDYITDTDSLQAEDAAQPCHALSDISPAFQAAFDELTPRSRVTIAEEANSLPMPDADTAARAVDLVIATLFDVFRDTRMEPAAPKLTTGIILAFVNAADRSRGEWHSATDRLRDLHEDNDGSEVATVELEDQTTLCQSLEEVYNVACAMRDRAIAAWEAETGRAFVTTKRASILHAKNTASLIDANDYLRAIRQKQQDAVAPQGPIVIASGGTVWHDADIIHRALDPIKERIPNMVLATTGQDSGVDAIALAWARRNGVHVVAFRPNFNRDGRRAGYRRNDRMLALKTIVEAVLCEGSQVQVDLYTKLSKRGVPVHTINSADQAPVQQSMSKFRRSA